MKIPKEIVLNIDLVKTHGVMVGYIYSILKINSSISRDELANLCNTSVSTIKRTINYMVDQKIINRIESSGKENTYKVIPLDGDTAKQQPEKELKHKYGEYQHVELTAKQYASLVKRYNENTVNDAIKAMDEYCEKHGKKYANCYLKLIEWIDQDNDKKLYYGKRRRGKKSYVKGGIRDQEMANLDQYLDCVNLYTVDATNKEDDE